MIVEQGLSHQEIMLRLNIPSSTYFSWLDLLFQQEQKAITGDFYTYQRLLNEILILNQRFLRRARKLTEIGDDKNVDPKWRIEAHSQAAQLERAVCNMTFVGPSYLRTKGQLPELQNVLDTIGDSSGELGFTHVGPMSDEWEEQYDLNNKQYELADGYRKEEIERQIKEQKKEQKKEQEQQRQQEEKTET